MATAATVLVGAVVFLTMGGNSPHASADTPPVAMPKVVGMTVTQAQSTLDNFYETDLAASPQEVSSLVAVTESPAGYYDSANDGLVIQQEPAFGYPMTASIQVQLVAGYEGYPPGGTSTAPTGPTDYAQN
jgi:hypothetical protein